MNGPQNQSPRPPLFMLIFFSMFGFIGVAVLIFLWTAKGFGAPPLIFKVFGSFIALGFMAMGFGLPLTALSKSRRKSNREVRLDSAQVSKPPSGGYDCPNCGGNQVPRPIRPPNMLAKHPASAERFLKPHPECNDNG